jgi:hypothetical protein
LSLTIKNQYRFTQIKRKSQISNSKFQINLNHQKIEITNLNHQIPNKSQSPNSKLQSTKGLIFEIWSLRFGNYLKVGT